MLQSGPTCMYTCELPDKGSHFLVSLNDVEDSVGQKYIFGINSFGIENIS